jgi:hypothetical protein
MKTTDPRMKRAWPWSVCAIGLLAAVGVLISVAMRRSHAPFVTRPAALVEAGPKSVGRSEAPNQLTPAEEAAAALQREWGIQAVGIHRSVAGAMLDFRYRVLDPEKASAMAYQEDVSYLIDEATGDRLNLPPIPKSGPLRETALNLEPGRQYSILIPNPAGRLKAGDRVTVVIGDFRASNLAID